MSGGGNRGSTYGSSSRGRSSSDCKEIKFETTIFSPIPAVLAKVSKGDKLEIVLEKTGGISIIAITKSGDILGTILAKESLKLITCIENDFEFIGTIKVIKSGSCTILIESK